MKVLEHCLNSGRSFGVELEVGNNALLEEIYNGVKFASKHAVRCTQTWSESNNNDCWHIKTDATCGEKGRDGPPGWEIASFKAKGLDDLEEIVHVAKSLEKSALAINENCGLHVHIGIGDFNYQQAGVLLALWVKIEKWMCQLVPHHRVHGKYCQLLTKRNYSRRDFYNPESLWELFKPRILRSHNNPHKMVAMNLVNYTRFVEKSVFPLNGRRPTVEFRLPESTLDWRSIVTWVVLFMGLVDVASWHSMPKNLRTASSLPEFLSYVGLKRSKKNYVLDELLEFSRVWTLLRIQEYGDGNKRNQALKMLNFMAN